MKKSFINNTALSTLGISLGALAMLAMPSEAQAQIDEIVTTAQRREQNVADVPIAVTVLSPERLEALQIKDTIGLVDVIPNLQGTNNTGLGSANTYFLRGQGQDESFATFDPAVGTYVDDIFVSRQNASNFSFFDIERLEVLRGPQGTLFGKNTSGGAINISLRKPGEEAGGFFEAGYGKYDRAQVRMAADIPLSENVRSSVNFFAIKDDGWLENTRTGNDLNDKDAIGVRGALSIDLSDTMTWDVSADYVTDSQVNATGRLNSDGEVQTNTQLFSGGLGAVTIFPGISSQTARQKANPGNDTRAFNITSKLTKEFDSGTASLIIGSRDLEQDFLVNFPFPAFAPPVTFSGSTMGERTDDPFIIDNIGTHDQFSAELKWDASYMNDRLDLTTGLFYLKEDNVTDVAAYFFALNRDRVISNDATSLAVYAQGDYHLTDQLTATVGMRYTDQEKTFDISDNNPDAGGAGGPTGDMSDLTSANMDALSIDREINDKILTPRFALQYDVNDSTNVYVSATRGFRSGGWNARVNTANRLTPFLTEKIWSYELGLRTVIADQLEFFATGFYYDLDDLQINVGTGGGNFDIGNSGGLKNVGVELEANWQPIDGLLVFGNLGLQDANYKPDQSEFDDCTAPNTRFGALDADCNVARVKRTPKSTITAGASYDISLGGWTVTPRGNIRVVSEHVTTSRDRGFEDGYTLYNAGVDFKPDSNAVVFSLECTNCENTRYRTATFGGGDVYYNPPGRWQARVRYNFGSRR